MRKSAQPHCAEHWAQNPSAFFLKESSHMPTALTPAGSKQNYLFVCFVFNCPLCPQFWGHCIHWHRKIHWRLRQLQQRRTSGKTRRLLTDQQLSRNSDSFEENLQFQRMLIVNAGGACTTPKSVHAFGAWELWELLSLRALELESTISSETLKL